MVDGTSHHHPQLLYVYLVCSSFNAVTIGLCPHLEPGAVIPQCRLAKHTPLTRPVSHVSERVVWTCGRVDRWKMSSGTSEQWPRPPAPTCPVATDVEFEGDGQRTSHEPSHPERMQC